MGQTLYIKICYIFDFASQQIVSNNTDYSTYVEITRTNMMT
jgi:hypothetical protein